MNNNRHLARLYNYRKEEAKSIARAKQLRNEKIAKEKDNSEEITTKTLQKA